MAKKKGVTEVYLDQIFSTFIRLRDADDDGFITCCNCGKKMWWKESTNGHYVKRSHRTLRYDEKNCHAECALCNGEDANLGYAVFMVQKYGMKIVYELNNIKNSREKITSIKRKELADKYRHKIKQLRKEKGL